MLELLPEDVDNMRLKRHQRSFYLTYDELLPFLRDNVLFPVSRIPPVPSVLSHLISGTLVPRGI